MKTKTDELGNKFYDILKKHGKDGKGYQVDLLLQACKEAGLRFVPLTFSYEHTGKIPAQLFDSVWKAIGAQIEEIDV